MQKLHTFFQQKILVYLRYNILNFNDMLTKDIVSFEQPGSPKIDHYIIDTGQVCCLGKDIGKKKIIENYEQSLRL